MNDTFRLIWTFHVLHSFWFDFECVHYESLWWLACLCLCTMNKTPGEQKMSRLIQRGSLIICCTATMKRLIFTLQSKCCSGLMQQSKSRSQLPIKSSHRRVDEGRVNRGGGIMLLYIAYTLSVYLIHLNTAHVNTLHLQIQCYGVYLKHKRWWIALSLKY